MKLDFRMLTASLALLGLGSGAVLAQQASSDTDATKTESSETAEATQQDGERYGSFEATRDAFSGSVAGDYTAEELIGRDVVGPEDEHVATIGDLLIGHDDSVEKVVLDVGGFLGIGAKPVAVDIADLKKPAEQDGAFQISMTRDELEEMPQFEREGDTWMMM